MAVAKWPAKAKWRVKIKWLIAAERVVKDKDGYTIYKSKYGREIVAMSSDEAVFVYKNLDEEIQEALSDCRLTKTHNGGMKKKRRELRHAIAGQILLGDRKAWNYRDGYTSFRIGGEQREYRAIYRQYLLIKNVLMIVCC